MVLICLQYHFKIMYSQLIVILPAYGAASLLLTRLHTPKEMHWLLAYHTATCLMLQLGHCHMANQFQNLIKSLNQSYVEFYELLSMSSIQYDGYCDKHTHLYTNYIIPPHCPINSQCPHMHVH